MSPLDVPDPVCLAPELVPIAPLREQPRVPLLGDTLEPPTPRALRPVVPPADALVDDVTAPLHGRRGLFGVALAVVAAWMLGVGVASTTLMLWGASVLLS